MSDPLNFGVDLDEVVRRLEALRYFFSITDVLEASEALNETVPAKPPAAFVAVSREVALPNKIMGGGHRQRVNIELGVLFVESAARRDRKAKFQLERARKAVIRQLIGWTPPGTQGPLDYSGYRVVSIGGGLAWGECRFATSYLLSTDDG